MLEVEDCVMDLLQTCIELRLAIETLTYDRGLAVSGLEVCIRPRGSEGVIGETCRNEKETSQKN